MWRCLNHLNCLISPTELALQNPYRIILKQPWSSSKPLWFTGLLPPTSFTVHLHQPRRSKPEQDQLVLLAPRMFVDNRKSKPIACNGMWWQRYYCASVLRLLSEKAVGDQRKEHCTCLHWSLLTKLGRGIIPTEGLQDSIPWLQKTLVMLPAWWFGSTSSGSLIQAKSPWLRKYLLSWNGER
jgi:hypothetical protein